MPDLNNDGIITAGEILPEIQTYYSKENMQVIVDNITSMIVENQNIINEKIDDIIALISSGGDVNVSFKNFVTKDQLSKDLELLRYDIQEIINNLTVETEYITLTVTDDDQTEFEVPDYVKDSKGTVLIFNTTVRTDYSLIGNTLITIFPVPVF